MIANQSRLNLIDRWPGHRRSSVPFSAIIAQKLAMFAATMLLYLASEMAGIAGATSSPIREITDFLRPVGDAHVTKLIFERERVNYMLSGPQASEQNGELRESILSRTKKSRTLFYLGPDSVLTKERSVFSESPKLVAAVGAELYVMNLVCSSEFPKSDQRFPSPGPTGNVILFNAATQSFTNLTKLDYSSGKYARALRWFPKERVLLLFENLREGEIVPSPRKGTTTPLCFSVKDAFFRPVDEYPGIKAWYKIYARIESRVRQYTTNQQNRIAWTIVDNENEHEIAFDCEDSGRVVTKLLVVPVNEHIVLASAPGIGTYLADFDGSLRARISIHQAIDYDYEKRKAFLESMAEDENGEHKYWMVDLDAYLAFITEYLK